MTEILTEPVSAPNVWRGDELADAGRWTLRFTEEDFADFERALAHVSRKDIRDVTEIRAEDFPLSQFQERIEGVVDRLEHGLGLVLLRGLPIYDRFSEDEAATIYWGIGRHMGNLVPQNRKGDLVGQIRDLGRRGPHERAYATNEDLAPGAPAAPAAAVDQPARDRPAALPRVRGLAQRLSDGKRARRHFSLMHLRQVCCAR